jgi:hypothetical protein
VLPGCMQGCGVTVAGPGYLMQSCDGDSKWRFSPDCTNFASWQIGVLAWCAEEALPNDILSFKPFIGVQDQEAEGRSHRQPLPRQWHQSLKIIARMHNCA